MGLAMMYLRPLSIKCTLAISNLSLNRSAAKQKPAPIARKRLGSPYPYSQSPSFAAHCDLQHQSGAAALVLAPSREYIQDLLLYIPITPQNSRQSRYTAFTVA